MTDEQTCGRGLAEHSAVPAALAVLTAALADVLALHITALDRADPAAEREYEVYRKLADDLRAAATPLRGAANLMAASRDLPMGRHDMALMSSPEFAAAYARYLRAEQDLLALLRDRVGPA
jgi:hypothetical protein